MATSSNLAGDLNSARKGLSEALGDNMKIYLQHMKLWFRLKISKEDFDLEARRLLKSESAHLHNAFLLAILTKCQCLTAGLGPKDITSSTGNTTTAKPQLKGKDGAVVKKRPVASRNNHQQRFNPVVPVTYAPLTATRGIEDEPIMSFCTRELSLPDVTMVHGRMYVSAWENGLDDVSDESVQLMLTSVQQHLKNIIALVISQRTGYKLRERRFRYAMGTRVANPYLSTSDHLTDFHTESEATSICEYSNSHLGDQIPSIRLSREHAEDTAVQELAIPMPSPVRQGPVTLFEFLHALQLYKNSIPSHTVYATNVERIIHKMCHPSNGELEPDVSSRSDTQTLQHAAGHHPPIRF